MSNQTNKTDQSDQTNKTDQSDQTNKTDQPDQTDKSDQNTPDFKDIVKQYIKLLQMKMSKDEIIFLKKYHYDDYYKKMSDFVPEFKDNYPSLFQMIISGEDLSLLNIFFDKFNNIDNGTQTLNDARNELGNVLHNKYVKGKVKY